MPSRSGRVSKSSVFKAFRAAFPLTLPVMAGFLFLGISYGVLMHSIGLGAGWTFLTSFLVFAGSMQYVAITLFAASFNPMYALMITLMVNARHIFYGISMLDKLDKAGRFKPYVIFALCDETFSILCTTDTPDDIDSGWFMFFVAFLNRWYWITGTLCGAILGQFVRFNTKGLDFSLTALFAVIFLNQWDKKTNHPGAVTGVACSVLCLVIFGPDGFIIPAMALMLGTLALLPKKTTGGEA
jgi:4-azaleucine resistance transporter AzlC